MRGLRSTAWGIVLIVGLLCPSSAHGQAVTVYNAIPLTAKLEYDVTTDQQRLAHPILFVDGLEFRALEYSCGATVPTSCIAVPEPLLIDAANKAPFPHVLDVALEDANGRSARSGQLRIIPPPPPPATACPWVSPSGMLTPKPVFPNPGYDDVRGWNVLEAVKDAGGILRPTAAGAAAQYAREKQLRAWGMDYRVLATDDGTKVFRDGKLRVYIYAPCIGPPQ